MTLTFSEWQISRNIRPWTIIHRWSEFKYRWKLLVRDITRVFKNIIQAFNEIMTKAWDTVQAFGNLFAALPINNQGRGL